MPAKAAMLRGRLRRAGRHVRHARPGRCCPHAGEASCATRAGALRRPPPESPASSATPMSVLSLVDRAVSVSASCPVRLAWTA